MAEPRTSQSGLISIGLGMLALAASIASLPWSMARFGSRPAGTPAPAASGIPVAKDEGPERAANLPEDQFGPIEAIQPAPLAPFPHDPPPHEGALITVPYVVEPPDVIAIEVLEALPGRPISGERL